MKHLFFTGMVALAVLSTVPLQAASVYFSGYSFQSCVTRSGGGQYREFYENGQNLLKVKPDEEYSIIVRNPLPVRAAVAVSIDGLNSIDGKRTSLRNAKKWLIEPYSSITIAGWQTSMKTLRKFLFTEQSATLAQWKEDRDGKKYTRNLGVIGVAWFWNAGELETALRPPQPFEDDYSRVNGAASEKKDSVLPSARAESKAGTGMGTQQQNHVTEVEFDGNAGMYSVRDVLKIYYEFAKELEPSPFTDDEDDNGRFTPDMNK